MDSSYYVPVLRWKEGEMKALQQLSPDVRGKVVPLIELVRHSLEDKHPRAWAREIGKEIATHCGFKNRVIIDPHHLTRAEALASLPTLVERVKGLAVPFSLVTGISWASEHSEIVKHLIVSQNLNAALRIPVYELRGARFGTAVMEVLRDIQRRPEEVDLVIDYQVLSDGMPSIASIMSLIPVRNEWKSIVVIGGSFPKDLSELDKNDHHLIPRRDWSNWLEYAESATERIPVFGDYAIFHGVFEEQQGKFRNFSASIRYTLPTHWLVMKGEGVYNENSAGFGQWPAHAKLLLSMPEYAGEEFSPGDKFIAEIAKHHSKKGTASQWLSAGVSHHVCLVAQQVAAVAPKSKPSIVSV